jgi:hypothetical protein
MFDSEDAKMLSIDVLKSRLEQIGIPTTINMSRRKHDKLYIQALLDPKNKGILNDKLQTAKNDKPYLSNKRLRSCKYILI